MADERLSPNARLLWLWLWDHAGRSPGRLTPTIRMMAAAIGAGKRSIESGRGDGAYERLSAAGLVEEVARDPSGVITLYVAEPAEAEGPRRVDGDPQTELAFAREEADAMPGEGGARPAATVRLRPADSIRGGPRGFCAKTARPPITHEAGSTQVDHNPNPRTTKGDGAGGRSADRAAFAQKPRGGENLGIAAELAESLAYTPDPAKLQAAMQRIVDLIEREIGTEGTDPGQPWIAAEAVVEGGVKMSTLVKVIDYAKRQAAAGLARRGIGGCFYGTLQKRCRLEGFYWPKKRRKP